MPNRLIHETSPYLLQHAHNPVDWYPYGKEAFSAAKANNKPMLISIGYSACHWCHVMEHECFSQPEVAEIMNRLFVCIKVDREERPDVDQVYMGAVQLLNNSGGWPLNCFALPDGLPFWGGTYFRPEQWIDLLSQISNLYTNSYNELLAQADRIQKGVAASGLIKIPDHPEAITVGIANDIFDQLSWSFDTELGGFRGAPKFPMPVVWQFVLCYHQVSKKNEPLEQLKTTLRRMACGGIFDQIGGGFARYSTDASWKVPHFEKMLYDNAQLVSLYANAFRMTGERLFAEIVEKTIAFVFRELTSPQGIFYSALDADSEGREGTFYLWTKDQLKEILPEYSDLLSDYWGVDGAGLWEKGQNILIRPVNDGVFASREHLSLEELNQLVRMAGKKLLIERSKRVRPGLDDKAILSWNALMIKALSDGYMALGNQEWLDAAIRAADFIRNNFNDAKGNLNRVWKNGNSRIDALLDDYAFLADAFIALYQVTFDEKWIFSADELVNTAYERFTDEAGQLFWYSPAGNPESDTMPAVTRMVVTTDGVEPSGNAVMAEVLTVLGHYLEKPAYLTRADAMINNLQKNFIAYPSSYAAWAKQAISRVQGITALVITGPDAYGNASLLNRRFNHAVLIAAAENSSELPVFDNRFIPNQNLIFSCHNSTCAPPVSSIDDLLL
ncbi:MAG: thioredoxin domain-containing protein [Lentimicrobium sp.]